MKKILQLLGVLMIIVIFDIPNANELIASNVKVMESAKSDTFQLENDDDRLQYFFNMQPLHRKKVVFFDKEYRHVTPIDSYIESRLEVFTEVPTEPP